MGDVKIVFRLFFYDCKRVKISLYNGNEILIDRKKKAITRSSVDIALKEAMEMKGIVNGPKKLNVFGASYLYSIFLRFGLIKMERE